MEPVLDMRGCRNVEELHQLGRSVAHKNSGVARKDLVLLCVQSFHFKSKAAFPGLLLADEVVSVDCFISSLPESQKFTP